jgi:hypothetical protein
LLEGRPALAGRIKLGLGINNSKLCGCVLIDVVNYDDYLAQFAPLWPSVRRSVGGSRAQQCGGNIFERTCSWMFAVKVTIKNRFLTHLCRLRAGSISQASALPLKRLTMSASALVSV